MERRNCTRHDFVTPLVDDYVICADWWAYWNGSGAHPFGESLAAGVLYRWNEYYCNPPVAIARFEDLQTLLLSRTVAVVENPDCGWSIYLSPSDYMAFPAPGDQLSVAIDGVPTAFSVQDIQVVITYTSQLPSGSLHSEDRVETQRALLPVPDAGNVLIDWIDKHHGLVASKLAHKRNLANPQFLNKNKPLRLFERLAGTPERRTYSLEVGIGVPHAD